MTRALVLYAHPLADSYASMRLEIGSAYTLIFLIMILPLLIALQFYGRPRKPKPAPPEAAATQAPALTQTGDIR